MLITVNDYEKITGKTLADDEKARVEALLNVGISQIENITGYKLEVEELVEDYDYNKRIYLNVQLLKLKRLALTKSISIVGIILR